MRIAIYGSRSHECGPAPLKDLMIWLDSQNVEAVMHRKLYNYLLHYDAKSLKCVVRVVDDGDFGADLALSLGGDGTFLRTAAWLGDKGIPALGINTGHLGYLTGMSLAELSRTDLRGLFDPLKFRIEHRALLAVDAPALARPYALNEVTIVKCEGASLINARCEVDGHYLADYRADGVIVATPTGSTAYNLSVGGPILSPSTPAVAIAPIAAHTLTMRPLVLPDESELRFAVRSRAGKFRLTIDGRHLTLPEDTEVKISKAPFSLPVIIKTGHFFTETLRSKLNWNV